VRIRKHRFMARILFGCLFAFAATATSAKAQTTAPNEWTWMGGDNTSPARCQSASSICGWPGVFGTLGTPAAGNLPGGRDSAATWADTSGNLWLFGGAGFDANADGGILNDLWEFDPATNEWTWMGGSSAVPASCAGSTTVPCGQPGVYGTIGSAAAGNIPGGRDAASYWTDRNGNFWLFGGGGFDSNGNFGQLNDLWEFNPATRKWTWMGGSSTIGSNGGQPGVYGNIGSAAEANIPGGRDDATTWTDKSGHFWLYGGEGFDSQGYYGQLDDLWTFDPAANEWEWVSGSSTLPTACGSNYSYLCGWPAVYGTFGESDPAVSPGSRVAASGWTDSNGDLWLFAGLGTVYEPGEDFSEFAQYDLWEFDPTANQWKWAGGDSIAIGPGLTGIFGIQGAPAIANIPPARNNATSWADANGNLWLFGGDQSEPSSVNGYCNDVWVFEPTANEWAWMNGTLPYYGPGCDIPSGTYGVLGTPAAENAPSGRLGSASWTDSHSNLWIFGGYGLTTGPGGPFADLNDLWIYQPLAPAPEPSFEMIASPNPINIGGTLGVTTGTTTVNIIAADGFNSPVTLSAAADTCNNSGGPETCATASFSPATIIGAGSSTLTISINGTTDLFSGILPLTITATSEGVSQSISVIVDVEAVDTPIGPVPPPSFSVPAGSYSTPQTVTLTDTFLGGSVYIYYTTDGTTPTLSSPIYFDPITVASTTTLKAFGSEAGTAQSTVSSATYTIVPPQANFSISGTPVSVAPGAATGNTSSITLTPSDGFTGVISLTCAITPTAASDPASCSIPTSVTINGSTAAMTTLTVNSTPFTSSTSSATSALTRTTRFFRPLVGGAALACILLAGIPARRRRWWNVVGMIALLFCVGSALGCGGSGGSGGGGNSGTSPGTYTITVTGISGTITETGTVSLTVQ
jgi:N-acetylneuraminic acid mutarotase